MITTLLSMTLVEWIVHTVKDHEKYTPSADPETTRHPETPQASSQGQQMG